MALLLDRDLNTGIELNGMYFRIDKINFNDTHFQVVATGYASEDAFRNGKMPISEPRAYTLENYDKRDIEKVFQFGYEVLKQHDVFNDAQDSLTTEQKEVVKTPVLNKTEVERGIVGLKMKGTPTNRLRKGLKN